MKRSTILFSLALAATAVATASLADERCPGKTPQVFKKGAYDFSTNSSVDKNGKIIKYFVCVVNNSRDGWLRVSWFIPLLADRWVRPGEVESQVRYSADPVDRPVLGCIKYGNLDGRVVSQFLGDANDEQKSGMANEASCRQQAGIEAPPTRTIELPPEGVTEATRLYVPSDLGDPTNSMLALDIAYGVKPDKTGYTSYFGYTANPVMPGSKANVDEIRVRPKFSVGSDDLYAAFREQVSKDYVSLAKSGGFQFSVSGSRQWAVQPAFYEFVDKDDNVLSSFTIPLFTPADRHQ
ncbi:MAG: hypothetical protein EOR30_16850 [Mesorhizobium sp.]|uniref:hypothetical protein n=1 Tax=unclassified Mesorhizobium TaxID=325217 RepID=UPI000FCBBA59|nr:MULTISPECIES: hypothetical protein [unclassified Mesorhizobium]RUV75962.1 hypothetical protein EOA78_05005 [Mesorhizobium sp. M5C.F.Cr.IN.023.01.1.1]RWF85753.1 MAG: hypothetical protein EOQ36_20810 [Mesorhizobium sp.]RWF95249.1 MAG: hypothetical protein EOQ45_07910 [Mesorhizobium sp.]RWI39917.1 MAG: hypothetical protein EOR14_17735 [Mesorhizobium sp.]RWI45219.1 MAG: hypothetical protein EOR15_22305 [Mesorhizobium sp.]